MPSKTAAVVPDILNTGHTCGTVTYPGSHKDRKKGQTFKYFGKASHV
jgi:hypothetical protein